MTVGRPCGFGELGVLKSTREISFDIKVRLNTEERNLLLEDCNLLENVV